jgi:hypothetical protein
MADQSCLTSAIARKSALTTGPSSSSLLSSYIGLLLTKDIMVNDEKCIREELDDLAISALGVRSRKLSNVLNSQSSDG